MRNDMEIVAKYTKWLEEFTELCQQKQGVVTTVDQDYLRMKYKTSTNTSTCAVKAGLLRRIAYGKYASNVKDVQPIHGRKLLEEVRGISSKHAREKYAMQKATSVTTVNPVSQKAKKFVARKKKAKKAIIPVSVVKQTLTNQSQQPLPQKTEQQPKERKRVSILWGMFSWEKN